MKEYDASTALWNTVYSECKLEDLTGERLEVEPTFDACLKIFAQNSKRVLDFGCGTGDILFQCAGFGYLSYGMGIDRSEVGIKYCHKMSNLNHYRQLDFLVGDISYFEQMEDGSFDGIIVSNVLDIVPKDVENNILKELIRLLREDGLMFIKLNPDTTDEELKGYGLTQLQDDLYEEDGVLRLRKQSTNKWRQEFEKNFTIERYLEFPYPWQEGMNRLFLLKKSVCNNSMNNGSCKKV